MSKKRDKQRRQQQRRQQRAAKTVQRHKDTGGRKHRAVSPYAVQFDQLEAEAIAGMMVGGADEFAERFSGVLAASDLLLEEDEFDDLAIADATIEAAVAPLLAVAAADTDAELEMTDEEEAEILGVLLQHLMRDEDFRADLLARLDQFIARARGDSALRRKWLAAVAVKFLLEQPPAQLSPRALSPCSLLALLAEEAWERYADDQPVDTAEGAEADDRPSGPSAGAERPGK